MISFTTRYQAEVVKYEAQERAQLPEKTKVRLLLRKSNLSQQQRLMLHTWAGETPDSYDHVLAVLHRLDDPRWSSTTTTGNPGASSGKTFLATDSYPSWTEEVGWSPDGETYQPCSQMWDDPVVDNFQQEDVEEARWGEEPEEDEEMTAFYLDENNDAGQSSEDEGVVWIYA